MLFFLGVSKSQLDTLAGYQHAILGVESPMLFQVLKKKLQRTTPVLLIEAQNTFLML